MEIKKYSSAEANALFESVRYPMGLSNGQQLNIFLWALFNKKKLYCLLTSIERGKALMFAYRDALNYKP